MPYLQSTISNLKTRRKSKINMLLKDMVCNKYLYIMSIPLVAYYIIFHYIPMYGAVISFKEFSIGKGILGSPWVGFKYFNDFFSSIYFIRVFRNTILISFYSLLFGFPAPIILALLLNEIRKNWFKRMVQTVNYLPHFISIMVVCGIIIDFTASNGIVNDVIAMLGGERSTLLLKPELFRTIYVSTGIWQEAGWGSIIYLASLTGIDPQLYESATIDGAGRWNQMWNITLPGIMPTIIVLLILRIGQIMNVGFEKIILLYNPTIYETADVISSFVYRKGLLDFNYSYSAAVGLFNSVVNFFMLFSANWLSRKMNETSLW